MRDGMEVGSEPMSIESVLCTTSLLRFTCNSDLCQTNPDFSDAKGEQRSYYFLKCIPLVV